MHRATNRKISASDLSAFWTESRLADFRTALNSVVREMNLRPHDFDKDGRCSRYAIEFFNGDKKAWFSASTFERARKKNNRVKRNTYTYLLYGLGAYYQHQVDTGIATYSSNMDILKKLFIELLDLNERLHPSKPTEGKGIDAFAELKRDVTRTTKEFFHRKSRDYGQLKALTGEFIGYRPCWRTGDSAFLIRSHVTISEAHGGYWLHEKQRFKADMNWKEDDDGVLFFAGKYAVAISSDEENSCFKTYVFTYYEPDSISTPANIVKGSVMAVSNHSEKHWAGPFTLVRKGEDYHPGPDDLCRVRVSDLEPYSGSGTLLFRALEHINSWEKQIEEGKKSGVYERR